MTTRTRLANAFCAGFLAGALLLAAGKKDKSGDAAKGKEVFAQCAGCHNAETDATKVGPSLKALFQRQRLSNGKPLTEDRVRAQIDNGGGAMPGFSDELSSKEKDDLIAYLKTL